jgi:hypothetical protein
VADWWYVEPRGAEWEGDYQAWRDFRLYVPFLHALIYSVCSICAVSRLMNVLGAIQRDLNGNRGNAEHDVLYTAFRPAFGNVRIVALPANNATVSVLQTLTEQEVIVSLAMVRVNYVALEQHAARLDDALRDICV